MLGSAFVCFLWVMLGIGLVCLSVGGIMLGMAFVSFLCE